MASRKSPLVISVTKADSSDNCEVINKTPITYLPLPTN